MGRRNDTNKTIPMAIGGIAAGIIGSRLIPRLVAMVTGSRRVRSGGDPFGLLIEDHERIKRLLQEMRAAPDSCVQRGRLFLKLKRKLAKHALAEEDVVYPIVHSQSGGQAQSKHLYDEHADMKILLYELEQKLKSGEDWHAEVTALANLVQRHTDEEEHVIFPQLRQQLAGEGLPQVSGQISREEALIV
jgi:hemerythrin-like domain-containing protein